MLKTAIMIQGIVAETLTGSNEGTIIQAVSSFLTRNIHTVSRGDSDITITISHVEETQATSPYLKQPLRTQEEVKGDKQ